jgi:hypothetical protein
MSRKIWPSLDSARNGLSEKWILMPMLIRTRPQ